MSRLVQICFAAIQALLKDRKETKFDEVTAKIWKATPDEVSVRGLSLSAESLWQNPEVIDRPRGFRSNKQLRKNWIVP